MLKWTYNKTSKSSMSGQYSFKGSQGPTEVRTKKDALTTNGNGPPPLIYNTPDDENMNEIIDEDVNLTVVLPDGRKKQQTVKPSIPMMDLLVNLAASNKLNPASHTLEVLTDDRWTKIDFKANKTIGLLAGEDKKVSVQIIPRKTEEKYKTRSLEKPFEITVRFIVNLPGKQKKVLRLSPKVSLGEVRLILCKEKGYDPSQFVFRPPGHPNEVIPDEASIGDFKVGEVDFVSLSMMQAAAGRSLPELAEATSKALAQTNRNTEEGYMPTSSEKKAKRGFLSMLGKKDKKLKLEDSNAGKRKTQSFNVHSRETDPQMRPKSMYVTSGGDSEVIDLRRTTGNLHYFSNTRNTDIHKGTGNTLEAVKENVSIEVKTESQESAPDKTSQALPKKKKKAAPPPPQQKKNVQQTVEVEIEVKPKQVLEESRIEEISDIRVPVKKFHSRNSSDSSGYHELTLSGAESPEGAKLENLQTTLDTTSIDSGEHGEHFNGDSGIRDMSPPRRRDKDRNKGADSEGARLSQEVVIGSGKKKKRAPLPPPEFSATIRVEPQVEHPEVSITTHKNDEDEALRAMEEVTMKFNIDSDDDHDMKMVENTSVNSEDVDIDVRRQRPPCNFVAPPPPSEPPPEDLKPVNLSMVVSQVDTVDVGVGDATTSPGPDSAKSSPRSGNNELKAAMPEFKQKISSLALETDDSTTTGESVRSDNSENKAEMQKNRDSSEITYEFTVEAVPPDFQGKETEEEQKTEEKEPEEEEEEIIETVEETIFYRRPVNNIEVIETSSPRKIPDLESPKEHKTISLPSKEVLSEIPVDNSTPKESVHISEEITEEPQPPKTEEKEEFVISLDELSSIDFSASVPGEKKEKKRSPSFDDGGKVGYRIELVKMESVESEDGVVVPDAIYIKSDDDDDDNVDGSFGIQNESIEAKNKCSELSFSPNGEHEVEHVMEEKSISMIALPAERTPLKDSVSNITTDSGISEPEPQTFASSTKIVLSGSNRSSREPSPRKSSRDSSPGNTLSFPRQEENSDTQQNLLQAQYQQLQEQFTMWQNQLIKNQNLLASQGNDTDLTTNQIQKSDSQSNIQLQQLQLQMQMQQQMMLQLQQSMNALTLQQALASTHPTQQILPPNVNKQEKVTQSASRPVESSRKKEHREHRRARSPEQVPPPPPTAPPPLDVVKPKVKADAKYTKPKHKRDDVQLDPRDQLMLDIRNRGRAGLKKVSVKEAHWYK